MSTRRKQFTACLVGVLALIGAACAPEEEKGAGFTPGPLGAVTVDTGAPIKIGLLQAISGDTASLGTDQVRAVEIAIEDKGGNLLEHPIRTQVEDDLCKAEGGTTAGQKFAADPQIVAVIGSSCSGAAVPAMEILSGKGILMISGSNTSPILTSDLRGKKGTANQKGYLRTAHNDIIQGQAAANFAFQKLGAKKAATIHDGDPYTEGLANAFGNSFKELGGTVTLATAISKGDTDMRPVLTEVVASKPDIVFFPIFQPEADFIVKQAKGFPLLADTKKLFGADGLLSNTFIVIGQTEGMYFSGPATPTGATYTDFVGKYEKKFSEKPIQAFHAHSYDAANMVFAAIEKVAVKENGKIHIDRQKLMDAVYQTKDYQGLTGTLSCDEFGDCANPKIDIVQNTAAQKTIDQVRGNVLFTFEPPAR
ncbi:branched-chain amino acid transport system substrate-binding protein [Kribbella sp. VKM Ac-2527]|uniref:Branched-chain amino acid transport system substrate-binding protein n=1 Tax=Kribbella caucasensis TaxID=2512215 RepID=A0A4R6JGR6_9ACTN|nr:branched-chain amino acid ABC transporter substrate-binding protein [Kribbella sp. VKM Ac-2527]TDO35169.1 branched-chain amino acid transport system substrate-binding protein [Kribbella sp. VKM Ac-2527]